MSVEKQMGKNEFWRKPALRYVPYPGSKSVCTAEPRASAFLSLFPSSSLLKKHNYPVGPLFRESWASGPRVSNRARLVTHFLHDWSLGAPGTPLYFHLKRVSLSSSYTFHSGHKK